MMEVVCFDVDYETEQQNFVKIEKAILKIFKVILNTELMMIPRQTIHCCGKFIVREIHLRKMHDYNRSTKYSYNIVVNYV